MSRARFLRFGLICSLVAVVLGCRWAVIQRYGSDLPNWDQWDAEGLLMLHPWYSHSFTLATPFIPQNEHRIVLTKLLNLGLTLANGQWDQRLEAVVNAILPALVAVGWLVLAAGLFGWRRILPFWLLLAFACGAPLSWNNVVAGFHSQQFFLVGLSFGAIACLATAEFRSFSWWAGVIAATLALGSMATGFFAAAVVLGVAVLRLFRREVTVPGLKPTAAVCLLLVALGWFSRVPAMGDDVFYAKSLADFGLSVLRSLQWPVVNRVPPYHVAFWFALPLWLPWLWLGVLVVGGAPSPGRRRLGWTLLALGGWVLLQAGATAYARGAGGDPPASRYVDTLVFGAVTNAVALAWLIRENRGLGRALAGALACLWLGVFAFGSKGELEHNFAQDLPGIRSYYETCERSVRAYIATGDEDFLQAGSIPYPSVDLLIQRLNLPELPALLPASVRQPLALEPSPAPTSFMAHDSRPPQDRGTWSVGTATGYSPATPVLDNRRTWGSFGAKGPVLGAWSSAPLVAHPGWLLFETAGQLGQPGATLELRDATGESILAEVRPSATPGDGWRTTYVRAPSEPFMVEARVTAPGRWLAFSEPVEMAPLSFAAHWLAKQGLLVAECAFGIGILFGLGLSLLPDQMGPNRALAQATSQVTGSRKSRIFFPSSNDRER